MPFIKTTIPGLIIFDPVVFEDSRGYFYESYNERLFRDNGIHIDFIQDNQSRSSYGVIRGLHYQKPPYAQSKLIRVVSGAILDLALDLRVGSPTYGQSYALELSAANRKQLFIPKGFAHGFSVLTETAEVMYKCDEYYEKNSEAGIRFDDPELAIDWQIPENRRIISEKDHNLPPFNSYGGEFVFHQ